MNRWCWLFILCIASFSHAGEVAVWGWYAKTWETFLKKEFDTAVTVIKPTEEGRVPVGDFSRFSLVILCQGGPSTPGTDEDLAVAKEYLSKGGRIILFSGTVTGWLKGKNSYDLSRAEGIVGATGYLYGKSVANRIYPGASFFLKETTEVPAWLSSEPGLTGITTGRVLVGGMVGKVTGVRLLINPVDKGCVFYCSPVVITAYKPGWEADPERFSQVNFLRALVGCALKDEPPLSKVLEEAKPKKTSALKIGGKVRPVAIKAEKSYLEPAQTLARILNQTTSSEIVVNEKSSGPEIFTVLVGGQEVLDKSQNKKKLSILMVT